MYKIRAQGLGKVSPLAMSRPALTWMDPYGQSELSVCVCVCVCSLEVLLPELPEPRAAVDGGPGP